MSKTEKVIIGLIIAGISLIFIGMLYTYIEMMIDHNCYQLEPNDRYSKTVCEKYWNKKEEFVIKK